MLVRFVEKFIDFGIIVLFCIQNNGHFFEPHFVCNDISAAVLCSMNIVVN